MGFFQCDRKNHFAFLHNVSNTHTYKICHQDGVDLTQWIVSGTIDELPFGLQSYPQLYC